MNLSMQDIARFEWYKIDLFVRTCIQKVESRRNLTSRGSKTEKVIGHDQAGIYGTWKDDCVLGVCA